MVTTPSILLIGLAGLLMREHWQTVRFMGIVAAAKSQPPSCVPAQAIPMPLYRV